jgi:hypothetical protein
MLGIVPVESLAVGAKRYLLTEEMADEKTYCQQYGTEILQTACRMAPLIREKTFFVALHRSASTAEIAIKGCH